MKRESIFGLILAAIAIALFYLFNKKGLLHEGVSSSIITAQGTVIPDMVTGFPQYDTRIPATVPEAEAFALKPLDSLGNATQFPANPMKATCPIGYSKWNNAADGSTWCLPNSASGNPVNRNSFLI